MTKRTPTASRPQDQDALSVILERMKAEHPGEWEKCRLWPTQSGIEHMIEVLSR